MNVLVVQYYAVARELRLVFFFGDAYSVVSAVLDAETLLHNLCDSGILKCSI